VTQCNSIILYSGYEVYTYIRQNMENHQNHKNNNTRTKNNTLIQNTSNDVWLKAILPNPAQ